MPFPWFQTRGVEEEPVPRLVPPGERIYAIGDIHGRLDLLRMLLDRIHDDDRRRGEAVTRLILLGDVIDRGPDSAGVVRLLRAGPPGFAAVDALMGNHEEILLKLLHAPSPELLVQYLRIGGVETFESYGAPERMLEVPELYPPETLLSFMPEADRAWFRGMADVVRVGDYAFVHAGVRPGLPLEEQEPRDLRWIRKPFLDSDAEHGAMIVHGHTVVAVPAIRANRIGIDTGAFASGRLTALGLQGAERWFLSTAQ